MLRGCDLHRGQVQNDGNCLYRAFYRAVKEGYGYDIVGLEDDEDEDWAVKQVRSMVMTALEGRCVDDEECALQVHKFVTSTYACPSECLDEYFRRLETPGVWGDEIVLHFLAVAFGVEIELWSPGRVDPEIFSPGTKPYAYAHGHVPFDLRSLGMSGGLCALLLSLSRGRDVVSLRTFSIWFSCLTVACMVVEAVRGRAWGLRAR